MRDNQTPPTEHPPIDSDMITFGEAIRLTRQNLNMPVVLLGHLVGVPERILINIEKGKASPNLLTKLRLVDLLPVSQATHSLLLEAAQSNSISRSALQTAMRHDRQIIDATSGGVLENVGQVVTLREQVREAVETASRIEEHVTPATRDEAASQTTNDQKSNLVDEIQILKASLAEIRATAQDMTVPLYIPTRESMGVNLIPATVVDRLEEYRSESTLWFSFFGIFLGAIIGVFVNVATGGELGTDAKIILGVFVVMALLTGGFGIRAELRGRTLRQKHLDPPAEK